MRFESEGVITQITLDGDSVTYRKAPDAATLDVIANSNDARAESTPQELDDAPLEATPAP